MEQLVWALKNCKKLGLTTDFGLKGDCLVHPLRMIKTNDFFILDV